MSESSGAIFLFFYCYADHFCLVIKLVCLLYKTSFFDIITLPLYDLYFCLLNKLVRCIRMKTELCIFFANKPGVGVGLWVANKPRVAPQE